MKEDQSLEATLRKNGLRVTLQRVAVHSILRNDREHPSTDTIYRKLHKRLPNISFDTVNRILADFAKIGILKIVEGRGGPRRYDTELDIHHHMHCTKCGMIMDFTHKAYDKLDLPTEIQKEFTVTGKKVVLEGYCRKCNNVKKG